MLNRTLCIQFRTKFGVKLNTKHIILHQIWCEIENKAILQIYYDFASKAEARLDILDSGTWTCAISVLVYPEHPFSRVEAPNRL